METITDNIVKKLTEQVTSNVGKIVADVLWAILGLFLFGLFYVGYKGIQYGWNRLTKSEAERKRLEREEKEKQEKETRAKKLSKSDREKCYKKIMEESEKIKENIITNLRTSLLCNQRLEEEVEPIIVKRTQEFIAKNIESVRIPIE